MDLDVLENQVILRWNKIIIQLETGQKITLFSIKKSYLRSISRLKGFSPCFVLAVDKLMTDTFL